MIPILLFVVFEFKYITLFYLSSLRIEFYRINNKKYVEYEKKLKVELSR